MASSGIWRSLASRSSPSRTRGLDVEAVVHQLEEVVVAPEDVLVVGGDLAGGVVVAVAQVDLHLAGRAAGGADQALAVLGEQLAVGTRLLEEAVAPGADGEPEQVVHALGALREQRHVGVGAAGRDVVGAAVVEVDALALEPGDVRGEVGLDADDRLDAVGRGLLVELVGPEHVAVVGHGDGGHPQLGRAGSERLQSRRAVEHGVLGVHVEVDEGVLGTCRHRRGALLESRFVRACSSRPQPVAWRRSWGKNARLRDRQTPWWQGAPTVRGLAGAASREPTLSSTGDGSVRVVHRPFAVRCSRLGGRRQ